MPSTKNSATCFHCGDPCTTEKHAIDDKVFCCLGCKTVFEILHTNDLTDYYELNFAPGKSKKNTHETDFAYLEKEEIKSRLVEFADSGISVINLRLPAIHCSSCIWLLEHLPQLHTGVSQVVVNFPKRTARITFKDEKISLRQLAELLVAIGYAPDIKLEDTQQKATKKDRSALYKLGIAGFAFGNVMIMALPEYFDYKDTTLQLFLPFFRWLMFALTLPVVFYAANDYFKSAYSGLKHKHMNIDVPIALGILVLFLRSTYDIISQTGSGYFDSLNGLVFFLLLGKFFQRKTYDSLSFERDYKSYFPVAVTRLGEQEESVLINDLKKGDRIFIRNQELIPADCILLKGDAHIDNSFVTGEASIIAKKSGDKIFAGGKQMGAGIELEVIKPVNQSYLTQLWNHEVFTKNERIKFKSFTDRISKHFTIAIMIIAFAAAGYWYVQDAHKAFTVFTAILIVACPCALALSAPFTHGNVLRIFGRNKFFVKDARTVERLAEINHLVWDKTGTLTMSRGTQLQYVGDPIPDTDLEVYKAMARQSNHPLSRMLHATIAQQSASLAQFSETPGKGSEAISHKGDKYKLGAAGWCNATATEKHINQTRIFVAKNGQTLGYYKVENEYRPHIFNLIKQLGTTYAQTVLSGDGPGEKDVLQPIFGEQANLQFNQKPADKLHEIKKLQEKNQHVLMLGDGLNDAGALKQSNVGVSISEDVNTFSPACDAILEAGKLNRLADFLSFSRSAKKVIIASFVLSFSYNIVGLSFAAAGMLSPVVSAILMPLSSITIVVFVTVVSNFLARKKNL